MKLSNRSVTKIKKLYIQVKINFDEKYDHRQNTIPN